MAKEPINPLAGAAGPGPFSTRTDNLTFKSDFYGAGVENAANLAGGPLAKTPDVRATSLSEMGMAPSQRESITPLYAPSQRKDEPITTGIVPGDGAGPEALGMNQVRPMQKQSDTLAKLLPFDDTGEIAILYQEALARGN
jgi:hypothetical protein